MAAASLVSLPADASTFFAWRVVDVARNDVLNVRAYPASTSRILVGYPNGTPLSLVGRCTGGVNVGNINHLPAWKQRRIVRHVWCAIWLDPTGNGNFREGWVYGRYIRPM
jgi:hypothetical protein